MQWQHSVRRLDSLTLTCLAAMPAGCECTHRVKELAGEASEPTCYCRTTPQVGDLGGSGGHALKGVARDCSFRAAPSPLWEACSPPCLLDRDGGPAGACCAGVRELHLCAGPGACTGSTWV